MDGAELKAKTIRFTEECYNKGDLRFMDELFDPNVVTHTPRQDLRGLEAYKQWAMDFRIDFPDNHIVIHEIIAEGNTVADRWTSSGTFTGPGKLFSVPGTGKKGVLKGTWFAHFVNGRIVENWYTYDLLAWLQQIGLMPTPEEKK
jgi:predicted ester cyclase